MKKFEYSGEQPHNSTLLVDASGMKEQKDVRLAAGDQAILPEDHPVIKALIDAGLLVEVPAGKSTNNKNAE